LHHEYESNLQKEMPFASTLHDKTDPSAFNEDWQIDFNLIETSGKRYHTQTDYGGIIDDRESN
jgi:hypothetical protein